MQSLQTFLLATACLPLLGACGGGGSSSTAPGSSTPFVTGESYGDGVRWSWPDVGGEYELYVLDGNVDDVAALIANPATRRYHGVQPGVAQMQLNPGVVQSALVAYGDGTGRQVYSNVAHAAADATAALLPALGLAGEERLVGGVQIDVAPAALWREARIGIQAATFPSNLPGVIVSEPFEITCDRPDAWNRPVRLRIDYSVPAGLLESRMLAWQFDPVTSNVQPLAVIHQDTLRDTVDLEVRQMGTIVLTAFHQPNLPAAMQVELFYPLELQWDTAALAGMAGEATPSLGASALAAWRPYSPLLYEWYAVQSPVQLSRGALRAGLAMQDWLETLETADWFGDDPGARRASLCQALVETGNGQLILLASDTSYRAVMACGYDEDGFDIIDPALPGTFQRLEWSSAGLVPYGDFDRVTWVGLPTLARGSDLEDLAEELSEDVAGTFGGITLTAPVADTAFDASSTPLQATIGGGGCTTLFVFDPSTPGGRRIDDPSILSIDESAGVQVSSNRACLLAEFRPEPRSNWMWGSSYADVRYFGLEGPDPAVVPLPGMVLIPAGKTKRGSVSLVGPPINVQVNELPRHTVVRPRCLWFGATEVTQAEFEARVGYNPSTTLGADLPVHNLNWFEARNFCLDLTLEQRGLGQIPADYEYRLPTEAEWEEACRGGSLTYYAGGNTLACNQARFMLNLFSDGSCGNAGPAAVGTYPANALGLYDMHGNVSEWTLDAISDYPMGLVVDPFVAGAAESERVVRGGSALGSTAECRSAYRIAQNPVTQDPRVGFRYVLAPALGF